MATLSELADTGDLVRVGVPLATGELPWRCLYGSPMFIEWLEVALPKLTTGAAYSPMSPIEQVYALFHEYVIGLPFISDRRFKKLNRTPSLHVWELKTPDTRIFGWAPKIDHFVCCFGDHADCIKLLDSYGRYQAQTEHFRANLDLDAPKSITSGEYADVISTAHR